MPFGKWDDFQGCLLDMQNQGHSEESAKKICGSLQAKLEGKAFTAEFTDKEKASIDKCTAEMEKAQVPAKEELKLFSDLEAEIFAVGTWNKDKYSSKNLQEMVTNFEILKDSVKPPAKIGHSETQELLKKEGLPAAGWVDSVKMVGNKVIATFKDVPKVVKDLIDKKAYRRVSAEIYPKYKDPKTGKTYNNVLRAVAFLGADIPAVETLSDIASLYSEANPNGVKVYTIDIDKFDQKGGEQIMGNWKVTLNGTSKEEMVKKLSDTFGEGVQVNVEDQDALAAEEQKKREEELKNKEIKDKKIEELSQQS